MKNSIKLTALLLLSSFSLFADTPVKPAILPLSKDVINLHALPSPFGVAVNIQNNVKGNAFIEITDQANHILLMNRFSKKTIVQKAYNLAELEDGDYTFTVHSNNNVMTKRVHIYEESGEKTWFLVQ